MASAKATIDHDEIQRWVEDRGGFPAHVKRTGEESDPGVLRIDYPGYSGAGTLERISWNEWFDWFDRDKLAFLYQAEGDSRFSKLVSRDSVDVSGGSKRTSGVRSLVSRVAGAIRGGSASKNSSGKPAKRAGGSSSKKTASKKASPKKASSRSGGSSKKTSRPAASRKASSSRKSGSSRKTAASRGGSSRKASSKKASSKKASKSRAGGTRSSRASSSKKASGPTSRKAGSSKKSASRKTSGRAATASSSSRSGASSATTTNHNEIRQWVEKRGGFPAHVKRTGKKNDPGVLRIDYPGYSGTKSLERISWDDWFKWFDRDKLAFLYQKKANSRFSKLVSR